MCITDDDAQWEKLFLPFIIYPPTTLQSVVPVVDQRFEVCGACCLRGRCALNRMKPLTGESERILPQPGHSTRLMPLSVNRLRSMRTTPENVQLAVLLVSSCSFAVSTVSPVLGAFGSVF